MKLQLPQLNKVKINVGVLLTILLLLVLIYEGFLVYKYIYLNLTVDQEQIVPTNVVRVDLNSYQETINYLDKNKNFAPSPLNLIRVNPFR